MLLPSPTWAISVLAGARSSCRGQECPYFALRHYCLLTNLRVWKVFMPYWVHVRFGSEADIRAAIELVRLVPEADVT